MKLHVHENPPRNPPQYCVGEGFNVWVTDVPDDFTDADVQWNIEQWASDGNKVALRALDLMKEHKCSWIAMNRGAHNGYPETRVYLDD